MAESGRSALERQDDIADIREVLGDLNARLMRKLGSSRREFFDALYRPALQPLPPEPYAYAEWRRCRVAPDYHIEVHGHFYSVPSRLICKMVEARITDTTIEVIHAGQRVAAHPRSALKRSRQRVEQILLLQYVDDCAGVCFFSSARSAECRAGLFTPIKRPYCTDAPSGSTLSCAGFLLKQP